MNLARFAFVLVFLSSIAVPAGADLVSTSTGQAEIVAYDATTKRLFVICESGLEIFLVANEGEVGGDKLGDANGALSALGFSGVSGVGDLAGLTAGIVSDWTFESSNLAAGVSLSRIRIDPSLLGARSRRPAVLFGPDLVRSFRPSYAKACVAAVRREVYYTRGFERKGRRTDENRPLGPDR